MKPGLGCWVITAVAAVAGVAAGPVADPAAPGLLASAKRYVGGLR